MTGKLFFARLKSLNSAINQFYENGHVLLIRKANNLSTILCRRNHSETINGDNKLPVLLDTFGRKHNYLRISLTERCNLRCKYCMPEEGIKLTPNSHLLSTEELLQLINLFSKLGVNKIRFTGGEPLIRKDIIEIIEKTSNIETIEQISITTNGLLLNKHLPALKKAGNLIDLYFNLIILT
ncbi:uncharacterized protein [Centruroides vittatus]|uniref:uncharacterized protein n=1 Tax=Centruroides vittatus TaxID=120091 RepID=UPI00350EF90F